MRKDLLLRLADLLEADASNPNGIKFDLREWAIMDDAREPTSCGTVACALGLAALSGEFQKEGLEFQIWGIGPRKYIDVIHQTFCGLHAASSLFEIPFEISQVLFTPLGYVPNADIIGAEGERMVADKIRSLVRGEIQCPSATR